MIAFPCPDLDMAGRWGHISFYWDKYNSGCRDTRIYFLIFCQYIDTAHKSLILPWTLRESTIFNAFNIKWNTISTNFECLCNSVYTYCFLLKLQWVNLYFKVDPAIILIKRWLLLWSFVLVLISTHDISAGKVRHRMLIAINQFSIYPYVMHARR